MKVLPLALTFLLALAGPALAQSSGSKSPDCTASKGPLPETWSGQAFAIDGDTIAGVGLKPHIRIWGIQAPELRDKQSGRESIPGLRARSLLADLLLAADQQTTCRPTKYDRYCRIVAQCTIATETLPDRKPQPTDLGAALVAAGLAHGYYLEEVLPWDPGTSARYAASESRARKMRTGLWLEWNPAY